MSLSQNNLAWIYVAYGLYYTMQCCFAMMHFQFIPIFFSKNSFFTCLYGFIGPFGPRATNPKMPSNNPKSPIWLIIKAFWQASADSIVSVHLLYKITQPSQMWQSIILEKKSAIGGERGKVVDTSPNDHIFIYTQTITALDAQPSFCYVFQKIHWNFLLNLVSILCWPSWIGVCLVENTIFESTYHLQLLTKCCFMCHKVCQTCLISRLLNLWRLWRSL
jgi:hypothetical protein